MRHLVVRLIEPASIKFFPGQYVDFHVPGTEETGRSRWRTSPSLESGHLEFVIKVYPNGLFSEFLDTDSEARRPARHHRAVRRVHAARWPDSDLVFVGGGAGMAPILALLRSMASRGIQRKTTFYYGARGRRDLCFEDELRQLEKTLPSSATCLRSPNPRTQTAGTARSGFITDVLRRSETNLAETDAYVCGPPPMVEAALELLADAGRSGETRLLRQVHDNGGPVTSTPTRRARLPAIRTRQIRPRHKCRYKEESR